VDFRASFSQERYFEYMRKVLPWPRNTVEQDGGQTYHNTF
jgi:hypothetical protein|tara:strand:+ start:343 stop:462 length:120 start_codon:yes stop_codon:yes gene_type:complete